MTRKKTGLSSKPAASSSTPRARASTKPNNKIRDTISAEYVPEEAEMQSNSETTPPPEETKGINESAADETDNDFEEGRLDEGVDDDICIPVRSRKRFTPNEVKELEEFYQAKEKPDTKDKQRFAENFNTSVGRIQIWFQNRRAKEKKAIGSRQTDINVIETDRSQISERTKRSKKYDKRRMPSLANIAESSTPEQQSQQLPKRRKSLGEALDLANDQEQQPIVPPTPPGWIPRPFPIAHNTPPDSMVRLRPMEYFNRPSTILPATALQPFPLNQHPNFAPLYPHFPQDRYLLTPHPAILNLQNTYSHDRGDITPDAFIDPTQTELMRGGLSAGQAYLNQHEADYKRQDQTDKQGNLE